MIDKPIEEYSLEMPPSTQVSENFQLWELVRSDIAARRGIDNRITKLSVLHNAIRFTRRVLQPIRDQFGPFRPGSVFRCQELERALKKKPANWVSASQHTKGQAGDTEIPLVSNIDLAYWIRANLEFDQLILECYNPALGPSSGWVHTSFRGDGSNRNEVLSYVMGDDGGYHYVDGIVADA